MKNIIVLIIIVLIMGCSICKHEWKILSKEYTKSRMEIVRETTGGATSFPLYFTDKYIIQIIVCKKCGKVKHYRDKN